MYMYTYLIYDVYISYNIYNIYEEIFHFYYLFLFGENGSFLVMQHVVVFSNSKVCLQPQLLLFCIVYT